MCDVCTTAEQELEQFLVELEEKYPGTEVDGGPVPRGHHVTMALVEQLEKRFAREVADALASAGALPVPTGLWFGGEQADIEA